MAETISPTALTTLQRVKDRILDTNVNATQPSSFDAVLTRMINSMSEYFERECGGRKFVMATYRRDVYSAYNSRQKRLVLRQAPVFCETVTGNLSSGSPTVTGVSSTTGMVVGMQILNENIPALTTITAISGSTLTLSRSASTSASGAYLLVTGIMSFQFRAGPPSNPVWTDFIIDQYELINDGKAGSVRIYGTLPGLYNNMVRLDYVAGYPVDWANAGNGTTHRLPAQISNTVENVVVRAFKRRMLAGKGAEGLEGATTSWNRDLDVEDRDVIDQFRRMPIIF